MKPEHEAAIERARARMEGREPKPKSPPDPDAFTEAQVIGGRP